MRLDVTMSGGSAPRRRLRGRHYAFAQKGSQLIYTQTVGAAAAPAAASAGGTAQSWSRSACTCRARSTITTRQRHEVGRGNILGWEQPLADRLKGAPLELEARMETQSILYRTLWLFGLTAVVAVWRSVW